MVSLRVVNPAATCATGPQPRVVRAESADIAVISPRLKRGDDCLFEFSRETGSLAVIERAVLLDFQTLRFDTLDRCRFGWHESGFSRSLDGWICNPSVRGRSAPDYQPLDEGTVPV
jgi:hypothetical protein